MADAPTPSSLETRLIPFNRPPDGSEGMAAIRRVASAHGVPIVEDAAQGLCATYDGRALGSIGAVGTISFDATKNVTSGSGGALLVNDPELVATAEALRDCGTDRARFARGEVERYRWVSAGSNGMSGDEIDYVIAAVLERLERAADAAGATG